jgi:hypothetical protein
MAARIENAALPAERFVAWGRPAKRSRGASESIRDIFIVVAIFGHNKHKEHS